MTTRRERSEGGKWSQSIPEEALRVLMAFDGRGELIMNQYAHLKAAEAGWTWDSEQELAEKWRRWIARYNAIGRKDLAEP